MAYKSLYRVYRPQVFDDVSGQGAIIRTLKHAVEENKIAHAYLFCGPRGTGKTTVAKLFAKAVNCTGDPKPCGHCESCKAIEYGTHEDVVEIDAASNNGVEEVRSLIEKVKYAPVQGKYKIYIIDEVHMMTQGAFNALLKTLEEPPAHVIFILATTEPHKILPTIISRCQRFDFTSLSDEDMINRMKTILKEEGKTYEEGALRLIAKLANGGMRDALSILEQCLAYNDTGLTEQDVNEIYGIVSLEDKIKLIKMMLAGDLEGSLNVLNKMTQRNTDIKRLTYDLIDILKDTVIYRNTHQEKILYVLTKASAETIVPYISSEEALEFIDILVEASEKYNRVHPEVYFEIALLKLCNKDHSAAMAMPVEEKVNVSRETIESEEPQVEEQVEEEIPYKEDVTEETIEDIARDLMSEEEAPVFPAYEVAEDVPVEEPVENLIPDEETVSEPVPVVEEPVQKEPQEIVGNIDVDPDDIMNILVQADKRVLIEAQEKWDVIPSYLKNRKHAEAAGLLMAGTPVAASPTALVIACEFVPDVNQINYYKNYRRIEALLKEVFDRDFRFVGIQHDAWLDMRANFVKLMKAGKLPQPRTIILKHIDQYDLDEDTRLTDAQQFAVDTFGEDFVELTEDDDE